MEQQFSVNHKDAPSLPAFFAGGEASSLQMFLTSSPHPSPPAKNAGREGVSLRVRVKAIFIAFLFLQGCASSDWQRESANQFENAKNNAAAAFGGAGGMRPDYAFANSSQTTKGMLIGGTTGAVAGSMTSVGFLPGLAGGAIFGGAIGAYIDAHTTVIDQIENRGGKVVVLGDQVLIVLPSSRVFNGMSATINPYAYSTLDLVAKLVGNYVNMSVKIASYVDVTGSTRANLSLSQEQANSVQKYLWRRGINTRMLYAVGYGDAVPVEQYTDMGCGWNYRIEITLESLPV